MMSNNTKEKPSSKFWKKLGLGKSKRSMSSLHSESALGSKEKDTSSDKRKSMIKRQSTDHHVLLPKADVDLNQQFIKHVDLKDSIKIKDSIDISTPIVTTKVKEDNNNNNFNKKEKEEKPPVPQPQPQVITKDINREPVPKKQSADDKQNNSNNSKDLLIEITILKQQLEQEQATVSALQNQKQAITKDLDYLSLTVETLENEKTDLIQQLEDEKVKNLQQTEDLNLMLEKMKSTADNARDKSFAMDHVKSELEVIQTQAKQEKERLQTQAKQEKEKLQTQAKQEKEILQTEIQSQNDAIHSLKAKLNQSHEYTESLQNTIDQLIKTHAAEISRLATEKSTFHTPNGSPRIGSSFPLATNSQQKEEDDEEEGYDDDMMVLNKQQQQIEADDLDDQLMKLTKEKERLQSYYSKIPLSGGGHQSRRRKEELESMLDKVDSKLSKVKQKIKRT